MIVTDPEKPTAWLPTDYAISLSKALKPKKGEQPGMKEEYRRMRALREAAKEAEDESKIKSLNLTT